MRTIIWQFCFLAILLLAAENTLAQKRKPVKRPPASSKKKQASKNSGKTPKSSNAPMVPFIWLEAFGGFMPSYNSGDYFDYQKAYYYTENPDFKISGTFAKEYSPLAGAGCQAGIPLNAGLLKFVSGGLSFSYSKRQFRHEVQFTNTDLNHRNKITINDNLSANYLGAELQFRFGSKVYGLLGIRNDFLLSGHRERILRLESDSVAGGKAIELSTRHSLKKSELVKQNSLGWHAGIGYAPLPYFGVRAGWLYNGSFFTGGPDFSTHQYYLALCFSFVK